MGYSAYSNAVFGLLVNKSQLTVQNQKRSCDHDTDLEGNFCSVCGEPVYIIEEEVIIDENSYRNTIDYFVSSADSDKKGILGIRIAETDDQDTNYYPIAVPNEKLVNQLKDFLNKHNIAFADKDLKVYMYTYHSY